MAGARARNRTCKIIVQIQSRGPRTSGCLLRSNDAREDAPEESVRLEEERWVATPEVLRLVDEPFNSVRLLRPSHVVGYLIFWIAQINEPFRLESPLET